MWCPGWGQSLPPELWHVLGQGGDSGLSPHGQGAELGQGELLEERG